MTNVNMIGPACDWKACYSPVGVAVCTLGVQLNLVPFDCSLNQCGCLHYYFMGVLDPLTGDLYSCGRMEITFQVSAW